MLQTLGLLLLFHASANAQKPCETLSFKGVFEGHTYFYSSQESSWEAANAIAVGMGGQLVVITSEEENEFVAQNVLNGAPAWIGLKETSREGRYAWTNGKRARYANWGQNEPNNAGGKESWTEINREGLGKWNDLPAGYPRGFVVEFESGDTDNDGIADVCDTDVVTPAPAATVEETADREKPAELLSDVTATAAPSLQLFPNPAAQEVQLRFDGLGDGNATLIVTDILGRIVLQKNLGAGLQNASFPLNLSKFSSGKYFVQVRGINGMASKVLTVAR